MLPLTIGSRPKSATRRRRAIASITKRWSHRPVNWAIAHDFKDLLTAIFGHLEMTESHFAAQYPIAPLLQRALRARGAASTRHLLAFASRHPALRPRSVDIPSVIGDAEKILNQGSRSRKSGWVICDEETKVDLWLHRSNGDPATFTDVPTEPSITELSQARILVCDDDADVLAFVGAILRDSGFTVWEADNP